MSSNDITKAFEDLLSFQNQDDLIEFEADSIQLRTMERIEAILSDKNISRSQLAKKMGTSRAYISQLFSIDKALNLKTLAKLQQALDVRIEIQPIQSWHFNKRTMPFESASKVIKIWRSNDTRTPPLFESIELEAIPA